MNGNSDGNNNKLNGRYDIEVKRTCCVSHCKSRIYNSKQLSETAFYPFPDKTVDFLTYRCWLREIRKYNTFNGESFQDAQDNFICELHFKQEDFVVDVISREKLLKKGSVPCFENERQTGNDSERNISATKKDPVEEQKSSRDYKLSSLKQKICHQKDLSLQKLAKQKAEQEQKLKQILVQQEQQKKQSSIGVKEPIDLTGKSSPTFEKQSQHIDEKHLQLLSRNESIPKHSSKEISSKEVDSSKSEKVEKGAVSNWTKKKQSLQMMLDQQKKRLADIQKQELLYEAKKRKIAVDDITESVGEQESTSKQSTASTSVISCGKCIKLEAELQQVTQENIELKNELNFLREKLQQKE